MPASHELSIIHQDQDLLVIDKPAGLITSTGPKDRRVTLIGLLREQFADSRDIRIGLVHRLDRDARGLIVFSKNPQAYAALKGQFADKSAGRDYAAIIRDSIKPPAGTIDSYLVEYHDGSVHQTKDRKHGQRAVTHYKTIQQANGYSLLRVSLETGRKHQIRAHLAEAGHPIVGDTMYGTREDKPLPLMLCAIRLELKHPTTSQRVRFEMPLPDEMRELMRSRSSK